MQEKSGITMLKSAMSGACALAVLMVAAPSSWAEECEDPDQLTFAMIPTEETVAELELYKPRHRSPARADRQGDRVLHADLLCLGRRGHAQPSSSMSRSSAPYAYVIAKDKDDTIDVFATYAKRPGHLQEEGPGYKAALVTKKGSGFTTIDSLQGKVLGLVDPGSTSGNLVPRVVFSEEVDGDLDGLFREGRLYRQPRTSPPSPWRKAGSDAAFVATHRFDNVVDKGEVNVEDFNVLWSSPAIPQDPFVYRTTLCDELKDNIKATFLGLSGDNPGEKNFLDNVKSNRFVEMTSADYDVIRALKKAKDEAEN